MKLRRLVTKVMSVALAGVMLATTVPMLADEVTTKQELAFEEIGNTKVDSITREDADAIGKVLGAETMTTDIAILDAESGIGIIEENSTIKSPGKNAYDTPNGFLGYITAENIYGVSLSRNDNDELIVDNTLRKICGLTRLYEITENGYTASGMNGGYSWDFNDIGKFGDYESLGSEMLNSINQGMEESDLYLLHYTYLTEDGEERFAFVMFLLEHQTETTILNFAEDVVTPETPSTEDFYEVELPADNTAISSTDFSAILTENATKDVVIESNEKVTFTFGKGTMSAVEGMENYDFGTSVVTDFASAGTMDAHVTADNFVTRVNFNYSGKLPATASIKIFVGTEYVGKTLYYSKIVESGFTYITSAVVDAEGYIVVTQDSCSDYVLTTEKLDTEEVPQTPPASDNTDTNPPAEETPTTPPANDNTPSAPNTGDSSSVALWTMVAICGLGCVVFGLKSKKMP